MDRYIINHIPTGSGKMGNYILCSHKPAKKPYYIEAVHLNIYSIEELCYFLSNNLPLSADIIDDELLSGWISKNCGLDEGEYKKLDEAEGKISRRLSWIFAKSHFFTENELRSLKAKTEALDSLSPAKKQKKKADMLVKYGKYKRALKYYEQIFTTSEIRREDASFSADIYYNMGVTCEKMFHTSNAIEYFRRAYKCAEDKIYLDACLKAAYFDGGKAALTEEATRFGVEAGRIRALMDEFENIKLVDKPENIDEAIKEWIDAYHRSVDQ